MDRAQYGNAAAHSMIAARRRRRVAPTGARRNPLINCAILHRAEQLGAEPCTWPGVSILNFVIQTGVI
jgi:hypothetical protein